MRAKPLHIEEAVFSEWEEWFAWRPVKTEQGHRAWLRKTHRRRVLPPIWFVPPAPASGWTEYSDEKRGYWD